MKSSAVSVAGLFLDRVAATPDRVAFRVPSGGGWKSLSWREVGERVRAIGRGLRAMGLTDEERCAIVAGTRFEWIAADLGILCAAGATTTIYPSSTADECAYILQDSRSAFAFAEDDAQVAKLRERRADLPNLRAVITFDGKASDDGWVVTLAELEAKGRGNADASDGDAFEKIARSVAGSALATLIYTSGTTGKPKGVELTHDAWVYEAEAIDALGILGPDDVQYLWAPLAHSLGKVLEVAQIRIGFESAVDGRPDKLVENLGVVKPTFAAAVPRVFEKVHARITSGAAEGGGLKKRIFDWAFRVGRRASKHRQRGTKVPPILAAENAVADRLVFSKLRARFGGRLRFFISGSAPLSPELAEFFHAAGILVLEGYGLTETSAASFVNLPHRFRFGTVGPAVPGTEVKIAPEDGEILIRGRGVMRGYHKLPDATAEALDADGWLHTGDIGSVEDGFLRITDRKKDLIKTSGGKYIAPQILEGKLKLACPYVSQVVIHGNNRNFCTALVSLDSDAITKWARESGLGDLDYAALVIHPEVKKLIGGYVETLNESLARFETIKKFAILPQDLSVDGGELTPSLKVKRKTVEEKYRGLLDGFYAGGRD